jgi:peptidyl-prolyl cis-trans isomerase C
MVGASGRGIIGTMHPVRHLLGCAVLGVLLFAVERGAATPGATAVDAGEAVAAARAAGFAPEPQALAAFAADARDEALLAREARRLGLDRDDAFVRETLASRMTFLAPGDASPDARVADAVALGLDARDPVVRRRLAARLAARIRADAAAAPIDETALRSWFEANRARWTAPATASIAQVFFTGDGGAARARAALAAIGRAHLEPSAAARLGDASFFGAELGPVDEPRLASRLGVAFARAAFAAPVGAWAGPVASSQGVHFLFVRARTDARAARLDEVRGAVESAWRADRADRAFDAALARLRAEAAG